MNRIIRDKQMFEKVMPSNANPTRSKHRCAEYLPFFDDTVGIHDKILRNCIDTERRNGFVSYQLVVTYARNEIFSYVPARRPRYSNRIGMTRSLVDPRGCIDRYRPM